MKRLRAPTGEIAIINASKDNDSLERIVRRAVLVHSGPHGAPIHFFTGDYDAEIHPPEGDIFFDDQRLRDIERNHNALINGLMDDYGGVDKMPDGAYPALLDQHDDDSIHRVIGRLTSLLKYEKMDVPGVGKNCSCLTADLTFMGKEIVERVKDGRIFHLSIGIDENTDTLGELSAVITPAAPGARLLKKGDNKMSVKKLAAKQKKLSTLKAMKETLSGMTKKVVAANEKVKLAAKTGKVTHRLTSLVRGGKITPAEFKKMNIKDLAALPEAHINTMMNAFEAMEPKILAGQRGTTAALEFSSIGKSLEKKQMKNLKAEIKGDFKRMGKKLSSGDDEEEEKEEKFQDKKHDMAGESDSKSVEKDEVEKKEMEMGDFATVESEQASSDLQTQVDELNTQIARIAGMVEELMNEEEAEVSEMSKDMSEEDKLSSGFGGTSTKEGEEKPVDDKKLEGDEDAEMKKKMGSEKDEDDKKLGSEDEDKKKLADKEDEDKKKLESEKEEKEKVKKELTGSKKKTK